MSASAFAGFAAFAALTACFAMAANYCRTHTDDPFACPTVIPVAIACVTFGASIYWLAIIFGARP